MQTLSNVSSKRTGAVINAYLVLKKAAQVLLSLRQNTGYGDDLYNFVSGHVEDGEAASAAIIREAKEEANLEILPKNLKPIHMMHRKTNRFNVDIFFECCEWEGNPENLEPLKCGGLGFYSLTHLPENITPYIAEVLKKIYQEKEFYSEVGW